MPETMSEPTSPYPSTETQLAVLNERLKTVIDNHETKLTSHEEKHAVTAGKLAQTQLQVNTHEVKISTLQEKAMGAFGKTAIFISTAVAALSLTWNVFK